MKTHQSLTDSEFEEQFSDGSLDPVLFTHEAHLRLAWIHISKYGTLQAQETICQQLVRFTENLGASEKFNKTLTIADIKAVDHFMIRSKTDSFTGLLEEFPRLKYRFKELMRAHYQVDIFTSEAAKKEFLEPDLLPF